MRGDSRIFDFRSRGQVAIFIILGIVIVAAILILIFFMRGESSVVSPSNLGPVDFVKNCVQDVVENSVVDIMKNGGETSPWKSILYEGESWNYLCYQLDFYQSCYNLHPMLKKQIEKEIFDETSVGVQGCFNSMKKNFEDRGFGVDGGATEYSVDILPGYISVKLMKSVDISDGNGNQNFEDFSVEILSPAYDLIGVARDIVNSESQFCNFEYNGYMLLYPNFNIRRIDYRDTKIYLITDRRTGTEFKFAVRSCAFPPGI